VLPGHDQSNGQRLSWLHLLCQSVAVSHRFEFHANGVGHGYDGSSFECESRQHRTELIHFERVITFHQHISCQWPSGMGNYNTPRLMSHIDFICQISRRVIALVFFPIANSKPWPPVVVGISPTM
jgi:hypothetical protein